MTDEQIFAICRANPTNKYICEHLDDKTMDLCMDMLSKLDANEFKEINPEAEFDLTCLPIPYNSIKDDNSTNTFTYSQTVNNEFNTLLKAINNKGTNFEYSYLLVGLKEDKEKFSDFYAMNKGSTQSVEYDWAKIEQFLSEDLKDINFSIFHTHPKAIGKEHRTLYNKHEEIFEEFGVKPDGINISISDIYANQYLDMLCDKYGKDFIPESTILMHDGTLISFSTKNGIVLTSEQTFELKKQKSEDQEFNF